ncbi:MAG: hypothetical protein SGPRY_012251, partial [Prymnesium sp.]
YAHVESHASLELPLGEGRRRCVDPLDIPPPSPPEPPSSPLAHEDVRSDAARRRSRQTDLTMEEKAMLDVLASELRSAAPLASNNWDEVDAKLDTVSDSVENAGYQFSARMILIGWEEGLLIRLRLRGQGLLLRRLLRGRMVGGTGDGEAVDGELELAVEPLEPPASDVNLFFDGVLDEWLGADPRMAPYTAFWTAGAIEKARGWWAHSRVRHRLNAEAISTHEDGVDMEADVDDPFPSRRTICSRVDAPGSDDGQGRGCAISARRNMSGPSLLKDMSEDDDKRKHFELD